jgi:hypothetical protein
MMGNGISDVTHAIDAKGLLVLAHGRIPVLMGTSFL